MTLGSDFGILIVNTAGVQGRYPGGYLLHKTSLAIDEDLLAAIDLAARERGESRNRFVIMILREAVRARRDREITKRLDRLFANESLQKEQLQEAEFLESMLPDENLEEW